MWSGTPPASLSRPPSHSEMRALLVACVLLLPARLAAADTAFVVVKNAKNPTPALSVADAKGVFSGRTKTWANGEPIVLVIGSEDSPAMHWLADHVFHVPAKTVLAKIKQDVFHGDVLHPLSADDDAKTVTRILSGAGVVGLVSEATAHTLPAGVVAVPLR